MSPARDAIHRAPVPILQEGREVRRLDALRMATDRLSANRRPLTGGSFSTVTPPPDEVNGAKARSRKASANRRPQNHPCSASTM